MPISYKDFTFKEKRVEGFHLGMMLKSKSILWLNSMMKNVLKELNPQGCLTTTFIKTLHVPSTSTESIREEIRKYKKNMSDGKLLFKFGDDVDI